MSTTPRTVAAVTVTDPRFDAWERQQRAAMYCARAARHPAFAASARTASRFFCGDICGRPLDRAPRLQQDGRCAPCRALLGRRHSRPRPDDEDGD